MARVESKRTQLVDAASVAKINRELARQRYEAVPWADRGRKVHAWHEYSVCRVVEAQAEDALFAHDLTTEGR